MNQKNTKFDMHLIDLSVGEPRKKALANSGQKKRAVNKKKKEVQIIGAKKVEQKQKRVIRADVIMDLDIIGEEKDTIRREQQVIRKRHNEIQKRKKKRKKVYFYKRLLIVMLLGLLLVSGILIKDLHSTGKVEQWISKIESYLPWTNKIEKPEITENLLDINEFSRPGDQIGKVREIYIHYTANPGTTAEQNRSYFENLADSGETSASAHFIIGYDGTIIQCIPLDEIGYAVADHNENSLSIECCYQNEDGEFTGQTYESLMHLTTWLMGKYHLTTEDVFRHYDASGKLCPKYYVEHPEAWDELKEDLRLYMDNH